MSRKKDDPNPDLETSTLFPSSHCEHLTGAWQSDRKNRDCFSSLATTIPESEFGDHKKSHEYEGMF